jgi:3-methylfumaryl-CoA hydratase
MRLSIRSTAGRRQAAALDVEDGSHAKLVHRSSVTQGRAVQVLDLETLRKWVGKQADSEDMVTPRLTATFSATFQPHLYDVGAASAPLGLHWCLIAPTTSTDELTQDGHPPRGDFLPPVPLPRRMWGGSEVSLFRPLPIGVNVVRRSRILDVASKQGSSGALCIVGIEHEYCVGAEPYIRERQNIVYREPAGTASPAAPPRPRAEKPQLSWSIETPSTLLFRYSALMFNAHRIHYDEPYVRDVEGYPGLVVQGPIAATALLNVGATLQGAVPKAFSCRGVAPLIAGPSFLAHAARTGDHSVECWTEDTSGQTTMQASLRW